ncbi:hypothetical protein GJ496_003366 [Pomphorhynchus laevis]|nr:hypothetical protein GJ496_003366 [Pomphorhynchus laevis]
MSDEEGFADSSTYSVASNVKKDSSFNNSSSSMELVNMNTVSCGLTNERKQRVRRRHRPPSFSTCFTDYYAFTDEVLGMGAQGVVCTCVHKLTNVEYAVKLINKQLHPDRQRVFKEMDIFYTCRNCEYILKLHEYFEDDTYFYLLFDKMHGGK